jgi:hypothetical protein
LERELRQIQQRQRQLERRLGHLAATNDTDTETSTAIAAALAAPAYTIRDNQIELIPRPTSLALKTRVFHVNESSDNVDDTVCCICFVDILDRDVVGDLTCCHMFHKDCIKDWLKRRNTCPLCLSDGIASLRYDGTDQRLISHDDVSETDMEPSSSPPGPIQWDSAQNEDGSYWPGVVHYAA